MSAPRRPAPPPLRTNDYAPIAVGTVLWAIAFVVLLVMHDDMSARGQGWWLWVTVSGFGLGLWGLVLTALNHKSQQRKQRRQGQQDQRENQRPDE